MLTQFPKIYLTSAIALALFLTACGESSSSSSGDDFGSQPPVDTSFDKAAMVSNLVDNVITPTFEEFEIKSSDQVISVDGYCQTEIGFADGSISQEAVVQAKAAARQSWADTISTWQKAEVMQLGPLLDNDSLLRNNIYSWPIVNSCAVDYDVVFFKGGEVNGQPYDITQRTPSRKGMAALEYLLFNEDLADSCESGSPEDWNNQTETYRKIARCEFATEVALDIANSAQNLVSVWSADDGYANQLKLAGTANSAIETEHDAVNRISDAMFYLDSKTKDGKLAEPLGLVLNDCGGATCPEAVESSFAFQSIQHIENNLVGFNYLFSGNDGLGFIDFLNESNAKDVADSMVTEIDAAIADSQAYEQSLAQTLIDNSEQVRASHAQVKKVTDQLKTDFINSLALELPQTSAGDND